MESFLLYSLSKLHQYKHVVRLNLWWVVLWRGGDVCLNFQNDWYDFFTSFLKGEAHFSSTFWKEYIYSQNKLPPSFWFPLGYGKQQIDSICLHLLYSAS